MDETSHRRHRHCPRTEWPGWTQPGQHSPPENKELANATGEKGEPIFLIWPFFKFKNVRQDSVQKGSKRLLKIFSI